MLIRVLTIITWAVTTRRDPLGTHFAPWIFFARRKGLRRWVCNASERFEFETVEWFLVSKNDIILWFIRRVKMKIKYRTLKMFFQKTLFSIYSPYILYIEPQNWFPSAFWVGFRQANNCFEHVVESEYNPCPVEYEKFTSLNGRPMRLCDRLEIRKIHRVTFQ